MSTPVLATIIKMIESLPDRMQEQLLVQLQNQIADFADEAQWEELCESAGDLFSSDAERVRQEIRDGNAHFFDYDRL